MNKQKKTRNYILCAFFTAIIAVCSWITIPLAVPVTLQTFAVFAALEIMGGKWGTVSICIYILLGVVGAPVFSGFRGGIGVLLGATGGYVVGFIALGLVWWAITSLLGRGITIDILAMLVGLIVCYSIGTFWFVTVYTKSVSFSEAMKWCVIPFIIPDLFKLIIAFTVSEKVKKIMK